MIVKLSNKKYMQIEQFDTGLKGQEKVEKIVISPEENYKYKHKEIPRGMFCGMRIVRMLLTHICKSHDASNPKQLSCYICKTINGPSEWLR